jgi:hypothetical protein
MLKRYMHRRERYFAMLNDDRVVRPFEWGTDYLPAEYSIGDPREAFRRFSAETIEASDEYFGLPISQQFQFSEGILKWRSAVATDWRENNIAIARYFPHEKDKKAAVVVLPHWNARAGTYFDLCRFLNRVGLSALRLTLPYHEERMPPELTRADYLVAPNIGLTLQSIRQSVLDTRSAVSWLRERGYERIGVVGTSVGSCVAFLAFVHDETIAAAVFNHVSGYISDVVWHGLSTYHVRAGLGDNITLDELREFWMPVSPMAYMKKLAALPPRPQRYIYTLYDLSFPVDLSLETMHALRAHDIPHSEVRIPCGHYTLGEKPWVYIDGYKIISFLRSSLR